MANFPLVYLGLLAFMLQLSMSAHAGDLTLISDNLDVLPPGYALVEQATENATADMQIGDIGGSNGLIFDGTWDVPAGGQESALGAMSPVIPTPADFQLDPADVDGIAGVRWTLDLAVISDTMVPPIQGIFAQLVVFQEQSDGTVLGFADDATNGNFIEAGQSKALDVILVESDFGSPGNRPDFSSLGRPLSFGLQFGATYPRTINPDAFFVDGRMIGDNWVIEIIGGAGYLNDGFEDIIEAGQPVRQSPGRDEIGVSPAAPSVPPF